uniref:Uncharacterized protein n=1 Tax=Arundo donax TaxID=35708 RepID=A0A0A8ZYW1_ARUDO
MQTCLRAKHDCQSPEDQVQTTSQQQSFPALSSHASCMPQVVLPRQKWKASLAYPV